MIRSLFSIRAAIGQSADFTRKRKTTRFWQGEKKNLQGYFSHIILQSTGRIPPPDSAKARPYNLHIIIRSTCRNRRRVVYLSVGHTSSLWSWSVHLQKLKRGKYLNTFNTNGRGFPFIDYGFLNLLKLVAKSRVLKLETYCFTF